MGSDYEACRSALENLLSWYESHVNKRNRNEATTRLHLIDTLLLECLGWQKEDCVAEEPHGKEYIDYSLSCPRRSLIVEAKKEGIYFELPAGFYGSEYSIKSLCRDNKKIKEAVEQALGYCQRSGTPLGAICNGHQLICFVATRDDGIAPLEGKAIVFVSLKKMQDEFLKLWKYLSKPGVEERNLQTHLLGVTIPVVPLKLSAQILSYPGIKGRNDLQIDLQIVGDFVIGDVGETREIETDFIKECFCPSGALSQYALISKSILEDRYAALFDSESKGPALIPATTKKEIVITSEILAESLSRRPILLIGDVGVGKTMFIRYLIKVAGVEVIQKAIVLYADLGSKAALVSDLKSFFISDIEEQLRQDHNVDIMERNFVRGVYNLELMRFAGTIYADLKEEDPQAYKAKEIEFLESKINNREKHLKECLTHLCKGRKKQVVLFLDNADQRDEPTQQDAFLIAQELAAHWPVTVFFAIRPETFHRSKKFGVLSGYHPKAFTISPPRVDDVINKRLRFALKIAKGEVKVQSVSSIGVKLHQLADYLDVLIYSFNTNEELIEFIDNVCKGNIRLALEFVTTFIGSGHVDTRKILEKEDRARLNNRHYLIALHEFLRAVIYGDNKYYDPQKSPIANVFDIVTPDPKEHFLLTILIEYINRASSMAGVEGFVEAQKIYEYAQRAGFTPSQIDSALTRALQKNLFESEARRIPNSHNFDKIPRSFRATTVGVYHVLKLIRDFTYVDAVIVDTPILDQSIRGRITDVDAIEERLSRALTFCEYLDKQWALVDALAVGFNWVDVSRDLRTDIKSIEARPKGRLIHRTKEQN